MENQTFYIVDVFAEEKYSGNQLAVILKTQPLSDDEMQRIAREINYSETTFILSGEGRNGGYDVRIFTPEREVPFAGHPTLGTAYIIQHEVIGKKPFETIVLNLKIGRIPVTPDPVAGNGPPAAPLWMEQIPPTFAETLTPAMLAPVLGLKVQDIDRRFPIEVVSTGLPFIIVPLKSLAAVKQCRINQDKYLRLIEPLSAKAILVFAPETYHRENHLNVRVFVGYYGIPEDPATGSANGCLAGYLVKHRYFGQDEINIQVEQGYEIKRPSLIYLKAKRVELDEISIFVGGKVILVAKGELV
jgi:trans-2,3-dihydro-3-hydroxyanthranilate isomerase